MEVILLKDVEKVGKRGEVVNVRDGFGRNFLLPRSLACRATRENRAGFERQKEALARRRDREKKAAEELVQKIGSLTLRLEVAVGDQEKLFGSVTPQDLANALQEKGILIDKRKLRLPEPIRTLGTHSVEIDLPADLQATLRVEVVANTKKRAS